MPTMDTPPYVPSNPSTGLSWVERLALKSALMYGAKRFMEVTKMNGYRTYLIMAAIAVASALRGLGYLDDGLYQTLLGILAPAGIITLKAGLNKKVAEAIALQPPQTMPTGSAPTSTSPTP